MKAEILAGGLGTRISEETHLKPKTMIEIGGKPILWHILKLYSHYCINDFIICCGYKGHVIKEYFANYFLYMSDVRSHMKLNTIFPQQVGFLARKILLWSSQAVSYFTPRWRLSSSEEIPVLA